MEGTITEWATLLAALSALATAVISKASVSTLSRTQTEARKSDKLNRLIQTVIHCNERYSEIEVSRTMPFEAGDITESARNQFFSRYWGLKSDQFDYWLAGFVDHDAFTTWMMSVAKHFSDGHNYFRGTSFFDGWVEYGRKNNKPINPMFVQLIDAIQFNFKDVESFEDSKEKVKEILSDLEGAGEFPGTSASFRAAFQSEMDYRRYLSENHRFSTVIIFENESLLPNAYKLETYTPTPRRILPATN